MAKYLEENYGEHSRITALMDDGSLLVIFVRDDDMSWTATRRNPAGNLFCPVASGQYWIEQRTGTLGQNVSIL